jgi:hypothetical protein
VNDWGKTDLFHTSNMNKAQDCGLRHHSLMAGLYKEMKQKEETLSMKLLKGVNIKAFTVTLNKYSTVIDKSLLHV